MKKIRFSITNLGSGGAEKILINILKHLPRDKYQLSLFLFEKSGVYLEDIPKDVELQYFINPAKFVGCLQNLYDRLIKKIAFRVLMHYPSLVYKICGVKYCDIDIAFIQDTTYLLKADFAKSKVAWIHCDVKNTPFYNVGLRENLLHADKIVCVSQAVQMNTVRCFPEYENKILFIYNPSPIDDIRSMSNGEGFLKYQPQTIVAVGRLAREKGFDLLINALKKMHQKGHKYSLKIIGEGYERSNLQNLINVLKLEDYVELLGFKNNPYKYIKAADLLVLSSYFEGLGQVLVEALCLGVPIVSSDCESGPRDVLCRGKCGLLVPVGDVEKLADGIELLMTDEQLREEFIANGLKRAQDFDLPMIMTQIEALFDEVSK